MWLLLVENEWRQKESLSFLHLLCSGMVDFGLRRNLGTAGKEHPSPPLPPCHAIQANRVPEFPAPAIALMADIRILGGFLGLQPL